MHKLTALAAVLAALVLSAPALAGPPSTHTNLGGDALEDAPRDVPSDFAEPSGDAAAPASQRGCTTRFQTTNFSARSGARPRELVAHYTVSRNVTGLADVNAIWSFFDRPATDASAHYIIDFEGNCLYAVPEDAKAWTQGAFNPTSISIEFIAMGDERVWPDAALRKGALVFADASKRWDIPIRLVDPPGCNVPAGVTDHNRLECGNHHTDVAPFFPMARFITMIREAAAPPRVVFFALGTGEGKGLAQSMGVQEGPNEAQRLREFTEFREQMILRELRRDGDVNIVRREKK